MRSFLVSTLLTLFLCLIVPVYVLCVPTATSNIDKETVELNEYVVLTIDVAGASKVDPPKIMGLENFSVLSQTTNYSTQFINGKYSNSVKFTYILLPNKEGVLAVGEAFINADEKRIHLEPKTINVENKICISG